MNKEVREKIDRIKAELEEMKKMIGGRVLKPKDGQKYWFISASTGVYESQWENHPIDHDRYSIGNCHLTKQSVEDTVRALKLIQKARESQNGFVPDWEDDAQTKYFLNFHMGDIGITDYYSVNIAPTLGFWEDESVCEQFIKDNYYELRWFFTEYRR